MKKIITIFAMLILTLAAAAYAADVVVRGGDVVTNKITATTINAEGGNLGIGMVPQHKLDVAGGDISVRGSGWTGTGATATLFLGDGTYHYIRATHGGGVSNQGGISIGTYGAQDGIVLKEQTGNVGIGTTTPGAKLDVAGNIKATDVLADGNILIGTPGKRFILFNGLSGNYNHIGIVSDKNYNSNNPTADPWDWANGFYIKRDGKVGIGTWTPSEKLEVAGGIKATGDINTTNGQICAGTLCLSKQTFQWITTGNNIYYGTGNVGIGTTQPGAKLDVAGNIQATGNIVATGNIQATGTGTNYFVGNVGIGTTTIPSKLTIGPSDTNHEGGEARFLGAGSNRYFYLDNYNGNLRFVSQDNDGESMKFTILNNGSVGIGTNNPQAMLHVNGSEDFNYLAELENTADNGYGLLIKAGKTDTQGEALEVQNKDGELLMRVQSDGKTIVNGSLSVSGTLHKFIPAAGCSLVKDTILYGGLYFDACDMGPGTWNTAFADCAKRGGMLPPTAYFHSLVLSSSTNYFSINTNYWTNDALYSSSQGSSVTVQYGTIVVTQGGNNYYLFGLANNNPDFTNKPIKWRCIGW